MDVVVQAALEEVELSVGRVCDVTCDMLLLAGIDMEAAWLDEDFHVMLNVSHWNMPVPGRPRFQIWA